MYIDGNMIMLGENVGKNQAAREFSSKTLPNAFEI